MHVIECAGIVEVVRGPHARVEFHALPVAQHRRLFAFGNEKAHTHTRAGLQFQHELIAVRRNRRGLDHAARENQQRAFGIHPRSGRHPMRHRHQRARRNQRQQRADERQSAHLPPHANQSKNHVRRDDGPELACSKIDQPR